MLAWKEKHLSGWLKEEQYLYKKINQMEMKQATTLPHYMSLIDSEIADRDNSWWNL